MRGYYKTIFYAGVLLAIACGQSTVRRIKDTSTSGTITIGVDDEYKPIIDAEVSIFQGLYANTHIQRTYGTEDSIFGLLLKDSLRLIITGRKLTSSEETVFNTKRIHPEQVKIASDAVVLIVNNNNPDTLISLVKIGAVLKGQDSLWKQMNDKSNLGKINLVFDKENSSNSHYIQQYFLKGAKFPTYCFALHNNHEVLDYVSKTPNAIGIIGVNWISDEYDTTVIRYLKNVKVVAISKTESSDPNNYYLPWPANMQTGQYPLCRDIYVINCETYTGLGSGLLSFITSNKGQRIVYREGLLPVNVPSHNIHF